MHLTGEPNCPDSRICHDFQAEKPFQTICRCLPPFLRRLLCEPGTLLAHCIVATLQAKDGPFSAQRKHPDARCAEIDADITVHGPPFSPITAHSIPTARVDGVAAASTVR